MDRWMTIYNNSRSVKLTDVPQLTYNELFDDVCSALNSDNCHVGTYFATPYNDGLRFICVILDDATSKIHIASFLSNQTSLRSIAAVHNSLHVFEREMGERYGIKFTGAPWEKPLRCDAERADKNQTINNYPFYKIDGESLHEVNVGPIHAGVIEPGVFRFICNGEEVIHLEIALGFQHRGVEKMLRESDSILYQTALCESVAGDSVVAHTTAYANVIENLAGMKVSSRIEIERAIGLELERIAMHIADCGALCMDIGYQLGQVACEALRTLIINTTQLWCGNRFAKGLIRTAGTHYTLNQNIIEKLLQNIGEVAKRFDEVAENLNSTPSVLARFEDCGVVSRSQALSIGSVGQAARACGVSRDIRASHPWGVYHKLTKHKPITENDGDVFSRLQVRLKEVDQSISYIRTLVNEIIKEGEQGIAESKPHYHLKLASDSLAISFVEGWRGEVCHVAMTDLYGKIEHYKIKDPSLHNWLALALSVRGIEISDFPICNKSFNLSYCGHDL